MSPSLTPTNTSRFKSASFKPWTLRNGRGSVLVATPISALSKGRYALDVHRNAGDTTFVACANLG